MKIQKADNQTNISTAQHFNDNKANVKTASFCNKGRPLCNISMKGERSDVHILQAERLHPEVVTLSTNLQCGSIYCHDIRKLFLFLHRQITFIQNNKFHKDKNLLFNQWPTHTQINKHTGMGKCGDPGSNLGFHIKCFHHQTTGLQHRGQTNPTNYHNTQDNVFLTSERGVFRNHQIGLVNSL
jgi:hypothetical protein